MSDDTEFYLQEKASEECACGSWKQSGRTFCYVCYHRLPSEMQRNLYTRGREYEEAVDEAILFLKEEGLLD